MCGSALDLERAFSIIEEEGPAHGLRLNHAKSLLYIPPDSDPDFNCLPPEIPTTSDGFVLLGSPVGPPSFCDSVVQWRISKIEELLQFLPDLEDAQMEYVLLRSCLSIPKFAFAVRTCPPHVLRQSIPLFDSVTCLICWGVALLLGLSSRLLYPLLWGVWASGGHPFMASCLPWVSGSH